MGRASSQSARDWCRSWFISRKLDGRLTRLEQEHGVLQHTVCIAVQVRVVVETEPVQKVTKRCQGGAKFSTMFPEALVQQGAKRLGPWWKDQRC